jgi:hypothetical protein
VHPRPPAREKNGHWRPGFSGNPSGRIIPMHKEVQQLAHERSPDAMRKLIALMDDEDSRVAYMAQTHVLERAFGKPKDYDPNEDAPSQLDATRLTAEERDQLRALPAKMRIAPGSPPIIAQLAAPPDEEPHES